MAYQSPISTYTTKIATNIGEEFDKLVVTEIAKVGVEVDKDELVKALEYDRDQYEKGYLDGRTYKPPVITRADQVRVMSDDEMAEFFTIHGAAHRFAVRMIARTITRACHAGSTGCCRM